MYEKSSAIKNGAIDQSIRIGGLRQISWKDHLEVTEKGLKGNSR